MADHLWRLNETFDVPEASIEALLDDLAAFIDSPTIEIEFIAPLLNFSAPSGISSIDFSKSLRIRRLTDIEVNQIFGGMRFPGAGSPLSVRHPFPLEWALVGTITDRKLLGDLQVQPSSEDRLNELLARGLLVLRTFRAGPIGYDFVRLKPVSFTPFFTGEISRWRGDTYTPRGSYTLMEDDLPALKHHGDLLARQLDGSLEAACARLADGEIRLQARDKLFDGVVGLEAILLASRDRYQGELRYRFAMNYAALFELPEQRYQAFLLGQRVV